jgi:metallo-beta-lactamase class B
MSKVLRFILSLHLAAVIFTSSSQSLAPLPFADSSWSKPYEPFRIAGNLYYVGTYDLACFLITTPEGHILINTGLRESVPMIRKSVEQLGFKFADIKTLLNTQGHYDHVAAFAEIKEITGAEVMVHKGDAQVLRDGGNSDFLFGGNGSMYPPVEVDRMLKDGDIIELGGTKIRLLHHPGHTKGASSFLIDVKDDTRTWKVLIANMPSILSQTRIFGMPTYPEVGDDYRYTLNVMKKIEFDLWVASHASQFGLHKKRKEGDPYRPEVFGDKAAYYTAIDGFISDYNKQ